MTSPMLEFLVVVRDNGVFSREVLIERGWHPKQVTRKAEAAARRGYTEFGVVADRPWLTDKGHQFIEEQ